MSLLQSLLHHMDCFFFYLFLMFDLSADDDSTGSGDEFSCAATGGFSIGSMSLSIGSLSFNLWLMIMVEIILGALAVAIFF